MYGRVAIRERRKDGENLFFALNTGFAISASSNRRVTYWQSYDDITDRKKAEEEQSSEMARLSSFPTLNPNPIVDKDRTLRKRRIR